MSIRLRLLPAILLGALAVSSLWVAPASAKYEDQVSYQRGKPKSLQRNSVSIYANSGGSIGQFALRAAKLRNSRTLVKFSGRCDSACTLFLGLPARQMCISKGAVFRFHAPMHRSARAASYAKKYMMRKYPGWVKSYIGANRGLTSRLVTMDYRYASRFIRTCVA